MNPRSRSLSATAQLCAAPGVSILVSRPRAGVIQLQAGMANLEHGVPIGPDTAFNVGSVAKQITAHLVLLAVEAGQLALDQPVASFLPLLRIGDITIADLITHGSGLRDVESLLSLVGFRDLDHYTVDDLVNLAYRQQQRAVPAGRFLYSNTNYLLLAEILRAVHGADLAHVARAQLFLPLGMTSTHFKTDPRQVVANAASAYEPTPDGWQHTARPAALPGPGALWTTPADLDRWLDHLGTRWHRSGAELPRANNLRYMAADQLPYLYGAGLYADDRPGRRAVFHYGHEQGFSAAARLDATGVRLVCLSNSRTVAADRVAASLRAELRGESIGHLESMLAKAVETTRGDPGEANHQTVDGGQAGADRHADLGMFVCSDVPGSLRLTRVCGHLHLWRRGTYNRLVRTGSRTHAGPGYQLTLSSADRGDSTPKSFTLDLIRAPRLHYTRQ
ncbi:serine hydrolase domain-containing protein [Kitasatospora sp. NPDC058965]|uniref:serine hydrolase domain-containing protein n=1 Tax=Kitasatospora sp. NPDC058965 TaxID=3346682 RepID=UPI0036A078B5